MKKLHIALSVESIEHSVTDYTKQLGVGPVFVLENEYALWRTESLNLSVRKVVDAPTGLRHLGWESTSAEGFTTENDCNGILWENFAAKHQAQEILDTWPQVSPKDFPVIEEAITEPQIAACFSVMVQLRPKLEKGCFVAQIKSLQENHGYRLLSVHHHDKVVAAAGFRILENLAWGKFLYVDDLVTDENHQSQGHAGMLLDHLLDQTHSTGCRQLHLDSGVQRFKAHSFYFKQGMAIRSHHFSLEP